MPPVPRSFWIGYVLLLVVVWGVLWVVRTQTLASLGDGQSAADWQAWEQDKLKRQTAGHPMTRGRERPPSPEPPHLVVLRDYFPGVAISLALVATAFYVFLWMVIRGVLTSPGQIEVLDEGQP